MQNFIESHPTSKPARTIQVVAYDPRWIEIFSEEARQIKAALREACFDVIHVGSTSVPGLVSKPVIDIITVVPEEHVADQTLASIGYRYKGEYNLPLRRMYGKKGELEVYLHVHEIGSSEIDLNVKFRDYLRENPELRMEYGNFKKQIISMNPSHAKLGNTWISSYNLRENDFIQKVLQEAGFKGVCVRLCTQVSE